MRLVRFDFHFLGSISHLGATNLEIIQDIIELELASREVVAALFVSTCASLHGA